MAGHSSMARSAQILRFVLRHRAAGVFSDPGAETIAPADEIDVPASSADVGPEAFVRDLEALGPTFIKIGQSLSTRPDMVTVSRIGTPGIVTSTSSTSTDVLAQNAFGI